MSLDIDTVSETPGRAIVKHNGAALVEAMEMALRAGEPEAAELVACGVRHTPVASRRHVSCSLTS